MNNKGQALVFVIILIPIIIILLLGVIEQANISYQKSKITSNIKTVIKTCYDKCSENEITSLIKKNGIKYEHIKVKINKDMQIDLDAKVNSLIGKIANKDYYEINVNLIGHKENNEIVIKKG